MKNIILIAFIGLTSFFQLNAHVNLNNPTGGEVYNPGDTVIIEWQIAISHSLLNWDLSFSDNAGSTWNTIQLDIPSTGNTAGTVVTYEWIVPSTPTTQARIKIVMDNSATDYNDITPNFTIQSGVGLSEILSNSLVLSPNPSSGTFKIEFETPVEGIVQVRDNLGRLIFTDEIKNSAMTINLDATPGIYFLYYYGADSILYLEKRIVIQPVK
ncbi:MAG: T9SS type A sorting domain-containing protein [Fluviicola sp.]|nr:T9SS type A sorting domain-containing protein [Fluviicola sp.]